MCRIPPTDIVPQTIGCGKAVGSLWITLWIFSDLSQSPPVPDPWSNAHQTVSASYCNSKLLIFHVILCVSNVGLCELMGRILFRSSCVKPVENFVKYPAMHTYFVDFSELTRAFADDSPPASEWRIDSDSRQRNPITPVAPHVLGKS